MPPHFGFNPSLVVEPGSSDIVVFRSHGNKAVQVGFSHMFRKMAREGCIKEQAKTSNNVMTKKLNGEEVDIKTYIYNHATELAVLYVNNTEDVYVMDRLTFILENAHIEGVEGNTAQASVGPGKEFLIKVVRDDDEKPFQAHLHGLASSLSRTVTMISINKWC
jgi:hypothetical protein